jgi:hypothetical protein
MAKTRVKIPKQMVEAVMKEYRHKCAVCGRHNPQLHHLNEDPSSNEPLNLLPLCPNCHLQDVHDPTNQQDARKLRLFRIHKDPLILDPRFHPIFRRMTFLRDDEIPSRPGIFTYRANELIDFVEQFEMGDFYRKKILGLLNNPANHYGLKCFYDGKETTDKQIRSDPALFKAAKEYRTEQIEFLLVEMIRYQGWTPKTISHVE